MARPAGQGEITKQRIAEKAKQLFIQKGYAATSMEDIREFSQISKGSIYYHFKSKEDLYLYTVKEANKDWQNKWKKEADRVDTATAKLILLGRYYASDMLNPLSQTVPEYIASENLEEQIKEKVVPLIQPEINIFYELIEEGIRSKEFESAISVKDLAHILYSALTGMSITQFLGYDEDNMLKLYENAVDVFLRGITKSSPRG